MKNGFIGVSIQFKKQKETSTLFVYSFIKFTYCSSLQSDSGQFTNKAIQPHKKDISKNVKNRTKKKLEKFKSDYTICHLMLILLLLFCTNNNLTILYVC